MTQKANMSLETIAKAVLVIALLVIIIIVMRNLIVGGSDNLQDTQGGIQDQIGDCAIDPSDPDCESWFRINRGSSTDDNSQSSSDNDFEISREPN